MKIKATDLVETISAIDKALPAIIDGHGPKWMDIAGDLSASRAALMRAIADVSVEVEAV